jgi:hypothetical protein
MHFPMEQYATPMLHKRLDQTVVWLINGIWAQTKNKPLMSDKTRIQGRKVPCSVDKNTLSMS